MSKDKYSILAFNTSIFALANLGNKLIKFFLVPYYTFYLTTNEYGIVDTFTTTVNLIVPLILLSLSDAVLRFNLKPMSNKKEVISSAVAMVTIMGIAASMGFMVFEHIKIFKGLWWLFYIYLLTSSFELLFSNFARSINMTKLFAISGIVNTILLVFCNIILLNFLHKGIWGYIQSLIIASIGTTFFLVIGTRAFSYIHIKDISSECMKEMLKYSLPLIPTAMMWWIMNASDRYIIIYFSGVSAAGIYAVAHKFPTVITVIYQIFQQAWQISAIGEAEKKDRNIFIAEIYEILVALLVISISSMLLFIKPLSQFLFFSSYRNVWRFIPFLLVGAGFSAFAGFAGINYLVLEKTKGAFWTACFSAVLNIILNFLLTPKYGMYGTSFATMISFFFLWIIRIWDTGRMIEIGNNFKKVYLSAFIVIIQAVFAISDFFFFQLIMFAWITFLNRQQYKKMYTHVIKHLKK